MAHMTLPASHTDADALLAERIGRALDLAEVHVFWTLPAAEAATAEAETAERTDPPAGLIGALAALGVLLERLGTRLVSRD